MTATPLPLRRPVLADLLPGALARDVLLVGGLAAAIAIGARLAVPLPFTPVPVTAQTFVVILGAAALGARRAALGTGLYLGLGLAGTPWFAAGGATLGYIVGFVLAAAVVGRLAERGADRGVRGAAGAMVVGTLAVYACGVPWLALATGMPLSRALALGVLPFLPGDALKVVIATALLPTAWRLVGDRTV